MLQVVIDGADPARRAELRAAAFVEEHEDLGLAWSARTDPEGNDCA